MMENYLQLGICLCELVVRGLTIGLKGWNKLNNIRLWLLLIFSFPPPRNPSYQRSRWSRSWRRPWRSMRTTCPWRRSSWRKWGCCQTQTRLTSDILTLIHCSVWHLISHLVWPAGLGSISCQLTSWNWPQPWCPVFRLMSDAPWNQRPFTQLI